MLLQYRGTKAPTNSLVDETAFMSKLPFLWLTQKSVLLMSVYQDYIQEIKEREDQGLHPKPIDSAELVTAIIIRLKMLVVSIEMTHSTF